MKLEKLIEKKPFLNKTVIFCGASKGIGKEAAILISKLGGNLCLIARGIEKLEETANECIQNRLSEDQFIEHYACDTTDYEKLKPIFDKFIENHGVPDYLINNVGYALPKYLQDYTIDDYRNNMDINYYGQIVPSTILIPYFIEKRQGHIINVSSMSGYIGTMGYGSYSPTKFAIVGWSEVARNELSPYNIRISVLFPPDTQTPGYDIENQTKPPECAMITETAKTYSAEFVAIGLIKGILKKRFYILPGTAKSIHIIKRFLPKLTFTFIDSDLKKARKKLRNKK